MVLKDVPLSSIRPYPNNPRRNDHAVDAVAESIRQCGYIAPIIVDEDGVILAGHTRYKALLKLGRERCQVAVAEGLTPAQKRKYRLLDNKTGELAGWDVSLLDAELDGLDFEGLDLFADQWPDDPLELDAPSPSPSAGKAVHCPKCGFEFAP